MLRTISRLPRALQAFREGFMRGRNEWRREHGLPPIKDPTPEEQLLEEVKRLRKEQRRTNTLLGVGMFMRFARDFTRGLMP